MLIRNCPSCGKEISYKIQLYFDIASGKNSLCRSCSSKAGSLKGTKTKIKTGNWGIDTKIKNGTLKHTKQAKEKISNTLKKQYDTWRVHWAKGKTIETSKGVLNSSICRKESGILKGKNNPMYGTSFYKIWINKYNKEKADKLLEKFKEKQKYISFNKKIKTDNFQWPNYNETACILIDKYGKENDYSFQHALNGGEVRIGRYFLDGYDKDKNVVIEFYEKWHYNDGKLNNTDVKRRKHIIDKLNCEFISINYKNEIEVFNGRK